MALRRGGVDLVELRGNVNGLFARKRQLADERGAHLVGNAAVPGNGVSAHDDKVGARHEFPDLRVRDVGHGHADAAQHLDGKAGLAQRTGLRADEGKVLPLLACGGEDRHQRARIAVHHHGAALGDEIRAVFRQRVHRRIGRLDNAVARRDDLRLRLFERRAGLLCAVKSSARKHGAVADGRHGRLQLVQLVGKLLHTRFQCVKAVERFLLAGKLVRPRGRTAEGTSSLDVHVIDLVQHMLRRLELDVFHFHFVHPPVILLLLNRSVPPRTHRYPYLF